MAEDDSSSRKQAALRELITACGYESQFKYEDAPKEEVMARFKKYRATLI